MPEISYFTRREIQAPIAACIIRGFAAVMGKEKAVETATAAIRSDAEAAGRKAAVTYGGNSLKELGRFVREVWMDNGALTVCFLEETERTLRFDVTRCRYAELYDRLGMKELGYCLSCSRDEPFIRGFNPHIKMTRTQTIMEGVEVCDFRFTMGDGKAENP